MKKFLILAVLSIFLSNCTTDELTPVASTESVTPAVLVNNPIENNTSLSAKAIQTSTVISLSTVARGFSSSVSIKNGQLTKNSTGVVPPTTIQISSAKWNVLKQKFNLLNLVKIPTYIATSCLRCNDMDKGQTLEIKYNGVVYTSQVYDTSNPPAALKDFVFYIKTL